MKKISIAALVGVTFLAGCTLSKGNPLPGEYPVEIVPTYPASVASAKAIQEGNSVVVSGTLRKSHEFHLPGAVEVIACGTGGRLLGEAEARISGHTSHRGGTKEARFSAELPLAPPAGTLFRLRYHAPDTEVPPLACP